MWEHLQVENESTASLPSNAKEICPNRQEGWIHWARPLRAICAGRDNSCLSNLDFSLDGFNILSELLSGDAATQGHHNIKYYAFPKVQALILWF